jgi:hypothetical protein
MKLVIYIKYQFVKAEKICVTVYRLADSCDLAVESRDVESI